MNLDEQISKRVDKGYRFELWNENVIPYSQTKIQKGRFLLPFFLFVLKICDEQNDEQVMKQNRKLS